MARTITFPDSGPFVFDSHGQIRCLKCEAAGWTVQEDGKKIEAGLALAEKKSFYARQRREKLAVPLPENWSLSGPVESKDLPKPDEWRQMMEENWEHARWEEKQRLAFASIYGGSTVAAMLTIILSVGSLRAPVGDVARALVAAGLAIYTILQYFLASKIGQEFAHHIQHISLLVALAPGNASSIAAGVGRPMGAARVLRSWRKVSVRTWLPGFYLLLVLAWSATTALFVLRAAGFV